MQTEISFPVSQNPDTETYSETSALLQAHKLFFLIYFNITL
jgi:hypothetical protein